MKRKSIQKNLIKNSIEAIITAIEIHNKPNLLYRYQTVTILLTNAWELLLKAFIRKYIKNKSIFKNKDNNYTISLNDAIEIIHKYFLSKNDDNFISIKENLELVEDYRNNAIHYYNEPIEPLLFLAISKTVANYAKFLNKYFNIDISSKSEFHILPIGFKQPFKPEEFLSKNVIEHIDTETSREFIINLVNRTKKLAEQGVKDTIIMGLDIQLESKKKCTNFDILAAISNEESAIPIISKKEIQYSYKKGGLSLSDQDKFQIYKYSHAQVIEYCKNNIDNFKTNSTFNKILQELRNEPQYAYLRKLSPNNEKEKGRYFYSEKILEKIKDKYNEINSNSQ